jgi:hypothetical protein
MDLWGVWAIVLSEESLEGRSQFVPRSIYLNLANLRYAVVGE